MLLLAATLGALAGLNSTVCDVCSAGGNATVRAVSANQIHKNPRPVEYRGMDIRPAWFSESEWADRLELAALARILYMYGFGSDLAAQCVMARLRDEPDTMLCAPPHLHPSNPRARPLRSERAPRAPAALSHRARVAG